MGFFLVLRVGGALVSGASAATFFALDVWEVAPSAPWSALALVAFIFFAGFVAWGWGATEIRLHRRPRIRVTPLLFNREGRAVLEVQNLGNTGHFRAIRQIVHHGVRGYPMAGYWEQQGAQAEINGGGAKAHLFIAELSDSPLAHISPPTWGLRIAGVGSDGVEQYEHAGLFTEGEDAPFVYVFVEISWAENMPSPFSCTYVLEQDPNRQTIQGFKEDS